MDKLQFALVASGSFQKSSGAWLRSLQLGQVLQARVVDKSPSGGLMLSVGAHKITAASDISVPKGASLQLEVSAVFPAPSMRIISIPPPNAPMIDPLQSQRQLLLSTQGEVLGPFITLLDPSKRVNILSLEGVKNGALDKLLAHLNQFSQLTDPKTLQKALLQSGLFLESELLRMSDAGIVLSRADMKGALFRLLYKINQSLTGSRGRDVAQLALLSLRGEIEGAIATITLNQLSSSQVDGRAGCIWLFDMPFRIHDSLRGLLVSIEREGAASQAESGAQQWKIRFSVELPRLGAIVAELYMRGSRVSAVFYVEQEAAFRALDERLFQLRIGLEKLGFEVSVLRCHLGIISADRPKFSGHLSVDEKI